MHFTSTPFHYFYITFVVRIIDSRRTYVIFGSRLSCSCSLGLAAASAISISSPPPNFAHLWNNFSGSFMRERGAKQAWKNNQARADTHIRPTKNLIYQCYVSVHITSAKAPR